jgi:tetratricopeptide (TPR) repeat protein
MSNLEKYSEACRLVESGHPADAIPTLVECCQADPSDLNARLVLGDCFLKVHRPDIAIRVFDDAARIDPDAAKVGLEKSQRQMGDTLDIDVAASVPGTESRESRGKNPRWRVGDNPVDWLDSLRRGISLDPKGQKQKLFSDEKSKQRVKTDLDRIKSVDDANESPVTKSIADDES